jgi:hypothetical protein
MWEARAFDVEGGKRLEVFSDGSRISFRRLFGLLEDEPAFASWYTDMLSASEADAFFWEHPALTHENLDADAELVLISAPSLARLRPDPEPFRERLDEDPGADVVAFRNLGGDATLIAPRPTGRREAYGHLVAFVRSAPREQVLSFWQHVGRLVRMSVGASPRWVSTAGMGVAWLHVRIDSSPKYYRHAAYKAAP